jgi:uncharacterized protein DUF4154
MSMRVTPGSNLFSLWRRRRAPRLSTGFWARLATVGIACAFLASLLCGQQSKPNEYQVKAAYLYNFGRFVKWPSGAAAGKNDFAVCVLGQDPFGPTLDSTLTGETLDGKPVVIRRLAKLRDAADCRILFVSLTEERRLKEILAAIDQAGVLTVSEIPGFSQRGGIIQFVVEGDRVRFEINLANAESSRLVLSSELLKVAATVRRSARSGG